MFFVIFLWKLSNPYNKIFVECTDIVVCNVIEVREAWTQTDKKC